MRIAQDLSIDSGLRHTQVLVKALPANMGTGSHFLPWISKEPLMNGVQHFLSSHFETDKL